MTLKIIKLKSGKKTLGTHINDFISADAYKDNIDEPIESCHIVFKTLDGYSAISYHYEDLSAMIGLLEEAKYDLLK